MNRRDYLKKKFNKLKNRNNFDNNLYNECKKSKNSVLYLIRRERKQYYSSLIESFDNENKNTAKVGIAGLGWRKAGQQILKGDKKTIFEIFSQILKGFLLEVGTRVETLESCSRVGTLDLDRTTSRLSKFVILCKINCILFGKTNFLQKF
jgi:hypothetical protein